MDITLKPDRPLVDPGKLLNLVVKHANGKLIYNQFMTVESFDYCSLLEEIRLTDQLKSEDVLLRLSELLQERNLVKPIESYFLNIGELGRPSKAVMDQYMHHINPNGTILRNIMEEIKKNHFDFDGPEGFLHLLKIEAGDTVGEAVIHVEAGGKGNGVCGTMTMDIVGPDGTDFHSDLGNEVETAMLKLIRKDYPDLEVVVEVKIRKSALGEATEILFNA